MKKTTYKLLEQPSRNKKQRLIGDIWLAKVPFSQPGLYYKSRPVLIIDYEDEYYICLKITTNEKKGVLIDIPNDKINSIRRSYLTPFKVRLKEEDFYTKLKSKVNYKDYIDEEQIKRSNYGIYKNW